MAWFLRLKAVLLELRKKRKETVASSSGLPVQSVEEEMRKVRSTVEGRSLSVSDLSKAESAIISFSQQATFMEEITLLRSGASGVKKTSDICRLDPVLQDGLLRMGGRLSRSALPEELKHPVRLSKGHHVSSLIMQYVHQQLGHVGRNHMLSTVRRIYWIINANSAY